LGQHSANFLKDTLADQNLLKFFFFQSAVKESHMFAIIEGQYKEVTLKNNTRQISSITSNAPMNLVRNTFHYRGMTADMAFLPS